MNPIRKQQILDVSIKLFYHRGISGVTMDDIAQSLSISKKTLYKDFKSKKFLLMRLALNESARFEEQGNAYVFDESSDYAEKCRKMINSLLIISEQIMPEFFKDVYDNHPAVQDVISTYKRNAVHLRFKNFIKDCQRTGEVLQDFSPDEITEMYEAIFDSFLFGNIELAKHQKLMDTDINPIPLKMANKIRILLRGVATDVNKYDQVMADLRPLETVAPE